MAARTTPAAVLFSLLAISGCSGGEATEGERHPNPDRVIHPFPPSAVLVLEGPPKSVESEVSAQLSAFEGGEVTRIGRLSGPYAEVFGRIAAAAATPSGHVAILDSHAQELRLFDLSAGTVQIAGGKGAGPGEFLNAQALDVDERGRILVFDGTGRVSLFEPDGASLRLERSFPVRGNIVDGCILNGVIYLHGFLFGDAGVIHTFTPVGEHLGSFGTVYASDNFIIRRQLLTGRIACLESAGLILFAPGLLGEVRAYEPGGELSWWIAFEGLLPIDLKEGSGGGTVIAVPEAGVHITIGLVPTGDGSQTLLQIALITRDGSERSYGYERLHTFVLSPDGSGSYHGEDLGPLYHWGRDYLIGASDEPYPAVRVVREVQRHAGRSLVR